MSAAGDSIAARKKREADEARLKIESDRQQASQAFMEAQARNAENAQRARESREGIEFQQKQARERGGVAKDIGKALGGGRFGEAQALGAASQFPNPRTGQLEGVGVARKPGPPEPGQAPTEPVAPDFVGPLETPDDAQARAMAKGLGWNGGGTEPPAFDEQAAQRAAQEGDAAAAEVTQQQAARDKFGKDSAAFPGAQADYQQRSAAYEADQKNPQYSISMPGGQSIDVDPREAKMAQEAEARDTAGKLRQAAAHPGQDPATAATMLRQADLIEAQISNADKAPITNMASATQAQGFKASESALDRGSREKIASGHDAARAKAKSIGKGLGAGGGLSELIKMKEEGRKDSEIAARAAQLGIPAGGKDGWQNSTKEVVRSGAIGSRIEEKDAGLQVTGENGEPLGKAKNAIEARKLSESNKAFAQLRMRLNALIQDVNEHGARVIGPDSTQRRNSLAKQVQAAGRVYNGLGSTDASQRIEEEIIGASGTLGNGLIMGANLGVLQHMMQEAEQQHTARLKIGLRAGSGPEAGPAAGHPSTEPVGATKTVDGKTFRKVGPNDWQPVAQ